MNKTKIEWCDSTWNPVTGCLHGCTYCYARRIANRFGANLNREGIETVELHYKRDNPYPYNFYPTFHKYRLDEPKNKTKGKNIFVCSMADLFGEWVPREWIISVLDACVKAPQHQYIFLTKNPSRYKEFQLEKPQNAWFGTTITCQEDYDNYLFDMPYIDFVSIEPLHGEIDMSSILDYTNSILWVIIGAQTGPGAVLPKFKWVQNIVNQCTYAGVPAFMKDSLTPIIGEKNMRRDFPEGLAQGNKEGEK